jgi:arrestin-related trafficking adapter 9
MPEARDPSPARRGGLLSRLRKPFDSSSRNTSDFSVQLDDEHRHYGPCDRVTGNVVLKVVRPIDITHIVVCLHGFAQVYKSPNTPGPEYRKYNAARVAGRTNKATGYIDEGFTSLLEDEQVLCGDGRLVEGAYQFGFELRFPRKHLPSSIDVSGISLGDRC